MFFPAKAIALSTASLGTLGISSYLIPNNLKNNLNLEKFFKDSKSPYYSQNTAVFVDEQKEKEEKIEPLLNNLALGISATNNRKEEKLENMKKILELILKTEEDINSLYEKSSKVVQLIFDLSKNLSEQQISKLNKQSNLEEIKYYKELLKKLNQSIENGKNNFDKFAKIIEEATKSSNNKNAKSDSAAGGEKQERKRKQN
ncbi:hypothetical protein [Mycoplasma parvum]|uniref:Uncharacterized protein n=1 Tax=Mycoplasma parvum str. Indiana TaxID=1403316 RepID=U5NCT9_9MOLU|nr:hypothetical protein [Mycoplasma parvum]AGX89155.1 hypothetical protein PRV_02085 [Mycoplasma parvum str. Indiana]